MVRRNREHKNQTLSKWVIYSRSNHAIWCPFSIKSPLYSKNKWQQRSFKPKISSKCSIRYIRRLPGYRTSQKGKYEPSTNSPSSAREKLSRHRLPNSQPDMRAGSCGTYIEVGIYKAWFSCTIWVIMSSGRPAITWFMKYGCFYVM